jgi:hypothetical protein
VAAGLFAGTTAWATNADPLHPSKPSGTGSAAPSVSVDPSLVALQEALAASTHRMDQLAARVAAVQAQAVALSGGKGRAVTSGHSATTGKTTTRSGSTSSKTTATKSRGGTSGSGSAPAPAAPPPPQATTGASGATH